MEREIGPIFQSTDQNWESESNLVLNCGVWWRDGWDKNNIWGEARIGKVYKAIWLIDQWGGKNKKQRNFTEAVKFKSELWSLRPKHSVESIVMHREESWQFYRWTVCSKTGNFWFIWKSELSEMDIETQDVMVLDGRWGIFLKYALFHWNCATVGIGWKIQMSGH